MAAENFKVKKGLEVGTGATITSDGVHVTGIITATQFKGDGSGLTGVVGSGSGVVIKDEGSAVGTAGTINFVGSGVTSTLSEGTATVTISSGGLTDVVDDTTPQLGGNLDLNSKFITGSGNIDITGSLDVSGISTTGFLEVGNLTNGRVAYVGSTSGRLVDSANLTFDGSNLFVSGINVTSAGTTSTFGADIVTRNLKATGITTISLLKVDTDLELLKSGSQDVITSSNGAIDIQNDTYVIIGQRTFPNNNYAVFSNGGVTLNHNNQTKLTTTSSGITVPDLNATGTGTFGQIETDGVTLGTNNNTFAAKFVDDAVANFGTDNDLKISHDNVHARITNSTGSIVISGIVSAINAASIQGIDIKAPNATSTMIGNEAGLNMSGAAQCVAVGSLAMRANVSSIFNTAVGVQALGALGSNASSSYPSNTAVGHLAGSTMTTGSLNTLIGANAGSAINSSANTILGKYDGNQGGLDIRSLSGNIVIADGNSNVRFYINPNGNAGIGTVNPDAAVGSGNTAKLSVGIVSAHQFYGDGSNITGVTASGTGIIVKHDGSTVGTAGTINFSTNLDVSAISAGIVTVTASGGSGATDKIEEGDTKVETIDSGDAADAYVTTEVNGTEEIRTIGGQTTIKYLRVGSAWNMANSTGTGIALSYSNTHDIIKGTSSGGLDILHSNSIELGQNGSPNHKYASITNSSAIFRTTNTERFRVEATGITVGQKFVSIGATIGVDGSATFAGIVTATTFSGSGASLTTLNASELASGTIANGRFPATLPAVSGANLTNLPVPTQITVANEASDTSCNVLFTTAATGDLAPKSSSTLTFNSSTEVLSATKFSGSGETLTNLNASNIASGTMSASRLTGALPAISGASLTNLPAPTPATSDIQVVYEITNQSSFSYFRFAGNGVDSSANNPDIYLERGQKYRFINNSGGSHPFQIQTIASSPYTTGVTYPSGTSASSGNIDFAVRWDAPAQLKYVCTSHGSMVGNIYLRGGGGNETNVGIITATRFSGNGSSLTNVNAATITLASNNDNTAYRVPFTSSNSGSISLYADNADGMTYNPSSGLLNINGTMEANLFSGSGASLTSLNADNISSGTVAANRVATLNQSTTGNAATATAFSVTSNNTTNETVYPVFVDGNSGTQGAEVDTALTYNPSSNTLTTGTIDLGNVNISSGTVTSSSSTAVVNTTAVGSADVIEYTIYVSNSTNIQSQKVLVMDNGTTAYISEFAVMSNPNLIVTFTADVSSGNVRLIATKESGISGSVTYKFSKMIIE